MLLSALRGTVRAPKPITYLQEGGGKGRGGKAEEGRQEGRTSSSKPSCQLQYSDEVRDAQTRALGALESLTAFWQLPLLALRPLCSFVLNSPSSSQTSHPSKETPLGSGLAPCWGHSRTKAGRGITVNANTTLPSAKTKALLRISNRKPSPGSQARTC